MIEHHFACSSTLHLQTVEHAEQLVSKKKIKHDIFHLGNYIWSCCLCCSGRSVIYSQFNLMMPFRHRSSGSGNHCSYDQMVSSWHIVDIHVIVVQHPAMQCAIDQTKCKIIPTLIAPNWGYSTGASAFETYPCVVWYHRSSNCPFILFYIVTISAL